MPSSISSSKTLVTVAALVLLVLQLATQQNADAKLLRRSRYYDDIDSGYGGYGGSPYGGGMSAAMPTGERALLTVRGTRNPYDGSAPSKITIEDQPYRGPYPRGVYDRLDGVRPMYPRHDSYSDYNGMGGYGGYGGRQMYGAPARIAVTGAFPYGYGARY